MLTLALAVLLLDCPWPLLELALLELGFVALVFFRFPNIPLPGPDFSTLEFLLLLTFGNGALSSFDIVVKKLQTSLS